jgi:hypothetical protein
VTRPGDAAEAARKAAMEKRRLAEVFGDVLPETTGDDRRGPEAGDDADERLRREVPPHHG